MMLRLTIDTPVSLDPDVVIAELANVALMRHGLTITTAEGTRFDVDLVNVDVVPEARLI